MASAAEAQEGDTCRPFAEAAPGLQTRGLAVIPLGGDDGKEALKRGYPNWKRRPGARTVAQWAAQRGSANVGVVCALSSVVVVDIDDAALLRPMLERFGDTPLIVKTRRGYQLWYRARGTEKPVDLRVREKLEVEIKAGPAAIVVVPPSWNRETGHVYRFEQGSWDDLSRLPYMMKHAYEVQDARRIHSIQALRPNPVGMRNVSLFDHLRHNFSFRTLEEVEAEARWFNRVYQEEPETEAKVLATARSVWRYMTERGARFPGGGCVRLSHAEIDALRKTGPLYPQSLALMVELKRNNEGRVKRGEPFCVSAHAMSDERVIPGLTNRKRIEQVRRAAEEVGLLLKIREACRELGQYRAALYTFGRVIDDEENILSVTKLREQ